MVMLNKKDPEKANIKPRDRLPNGLFKTKTPTAKAGKKSKTEVKMKELINGGSSTKYTYLNYPYQKPLKRSCPKFA